jgi:hypothetical protein
VCWSHPWHPEAVFLHISRHKTIKTPLKTMNQLSFSASAPSAKKGNTAQLLLMMAAAGFKPVLPPQKGPGRFKEGGSPHYLNEGDFVPRDTGFYGGFEVTPVI